MTLTCPTCETTYTAERCGVADVLAQAEALDTVAEVTVICMVCQTTFDAQVYTEPAPDLVVAGTWRNLWQDVVTPGEATRKVTTRVR